MKRGAHACGKAILGLIRNSGAEPRVIEYLKTPPDRETLVGLIRAMGITTRQLLRRKGTPYESLAWTTRSGLTTS